MSPRDAVPAAEEPDPTVLAAGRRRLRVVAAILWAEAAGLAAFAAYLLANLVGGSNQTTATSNTVIEIVAFFATAGVLGWLGRGCFAARRWARAPALVVQLIVLLGIGWPLLQGGMWYRFVLGVPVTGAAAIAVVLTFTPAAVSAFEAGE